MPTATQRRNSSGPERWRMADEKTVRIMGGDCDGRIVDPLCPSTRTPGGDKAVRIVDVTALDDEFRHCEPYSTRIVEVEAERIKIKVGTFEANLDGSGFGTV